MALADVTVKVDPEQIKAIEGDPPTRKEVLRAGYGVAKQAATAEGAPRRSGRGANSIRASVSEEDPNAAAVSWGQRYYYMVFHHDGWSPKPGGPRRPPNPFLKRAFEKYALL